MAKCSDLHVYDIPNYVKKLTDGNLEFAFEFYREAAKEPAQGTNLVLSPLGVAIAVGMLYHGAMHKTAEELKKILHLDRIDKDEDICSGFEYILRSISYSKIRQVEKMLDINVENWLHLDDTFQTSSKYERILKEHYQTKVGRVNFSTVTKGSLTEGISQDIAAKLSGPLSLLNVTSFKCKWNVQFDNNTRGLFHTSCAKKVVTKYMQVKSDFYYVEKNRPYCRFLELPYGGSGYRMYVILPIDIQGLPAIENMMTRDVFRTLRSSLNKIKVDVSIPKFNLNSELVLNQSLKNLGVHDLFSVEKADLTLMSAKRPLYMSSFVHKANIEVDEKGVLAPGAISFSGQKKSRKTAEFKADHPFMFIIYDQRRDFILFMGRVTDPNQ